MNQVFDILNNLGAQLGQGQRAPGQGGAPTSGNGGGDLSRLLEGKGGLATGAVAGGLAGLLLGGKKSRKFAGSALKVGGLALAGGLAFKAYQNWQRGPRGTGQSAPADPQAEKFLPPAAEQQDALAHHLIGAMIAAAKADGHISPDEQAQIESQLAELPMDAGAREELAGLLANSPGVDDLARYATTPEKAAEIYAASLLVIDPEGPAEKGYLAFLAARLGLDSELVVHLHQEAEAVAG